MTRNAARYVCLVLLAIGAGAALVAAGARVPVESGNRTVAIILDYDQLRQLSAVAGSTTSQLLTRLRQAGATHVAITEQTLGGALQAGDVTAVPRDRLGTVAGRPPSAAFVGSPETIERLHRSLVERLGRRTSTLGPVAERSRRVDLQFVSPASVLDLGIGYPLGAMQEINLAGLGFVPRPFADGNQWETAADAALELAGERNVRLVIFAGTSAPGYPLNLAHTAEAMREAGLLFGYVEFGKQYGDLALAAKLPDNLVRVHSINETEMLGMSAQRAVDRFALGVRERNIRACYVRLFEPGGPDPIGAAEAYVASLASRLRAHGFVPGAPEPYAGLGLSPLLQWLAMLGALGALGLCLTELLGCRGPAVVALLGVGAALALLGTFTAPAPTAKLCALLAALALPTLAVGRRLPEGLLLAGAAGLGRGLLLFATSSGVSLLAGLLIVGCLADTRFLLKLDQFAGVKFAHLVPLLAVLALQVGWELGRRDADPQAPPLAALGRGLRLAAETVVKYWHVGLLLVCVGALGLLILRSGNESGVGVSSVELHLRSLLDRIFGVRPRTKEALIGHPLLVLAFARAMAGRHRGLWALLTLGTVGQVSMVNTFCHLHTPVLVSVVRSLHGLWFGALAGGLLYGAVELAGRLWKTLGPRLAADPADAP